ncbi:MAG: hypothetical protein K6A94_13960 [Bacteroidales bacterium]|nr:hypothetical protein [Bacteroidales bacterium]
MTSCSTTRRVSSSHELRVESVASRDSVEVESVEVFDTLKETTTITVKTNEQGDTLMQSIVTDRYSSRDRSQLKVKSEKLRVETDTVYVIERDSMLVERNTGTGLANPPERKSRLVATLRWIFWILMALIVLIIILRFRR